MPEELHTTKEWIEILKEQADYTREYRHTLYKKVQIQSKKRILDIECGTGSVTADIASSSNGHIIGIDIDSKKLKYAESVLPDHVDVVGATVLKLPFQDNTFDLVVFNAVLSFVKDQQKAVDEMTRVTKRGGVVLATLELDYAGEVSYPQDKTSLPYQKHLEEIGIDVYTGRKLKSLFRKAGLEARIGMCDLTLDFVNRDSQSQLKDFLDHFPSSEKILLRIGLTEEDIEGLKQERIDLIQNDLYFGFVPAFYAIGRKK